ncbi:MAG: hypothetical protein C5B52_07660 [Bacteroidetes bacterium]|nr:MAG: hypothetical protein C5B52_07660 [Bacteroidota bacterium]
MKQNNKSAELKIILLLSIAIFPLLLLSFYNYPSCDDLLLNCEVSRFGYWNYLHYFYSHWSSRYFSLTVIMALASGRFLLDHYWLVPVSMISLFCISFWFFFRQVNKYLFSGLLNSAQEVISSQIFLLIFIVSAPEISTAFYWLSGSLTHTLPIILLFFSAGFYIIRLSNPERKLFNQLMCILFLIAGLGCSEILSIFILCLISLHVILAIRNKSANLLTIAITALVTIVCNYIFLFGVGNMRRIGHWGVEPSYSFAISASFLRYFITLSNILSNPFFWVCSFSLFLLGSKTGLRPKFPFKVKWWSLYFILLGPVLYFPTFLVGPGGFPERANNPITVIILISILLCVYHASTLFRISIAFNTTMGYRNLIVVTFFSSLIFSSNYLNMLKDQVEGPVYKAINDSRGRELELARVNGIKKVEMMPYESKRELYVQDNFPRSLQAPFLKLIPPYPRTIFFQDDLKDSVYIKIYAEYHGIDTLVYESKQYERISRDNSFDFHIK